MKAIISNLKDYFLPPKKRTSFIIVGMLLLCVVFAKNSDGYKAKSTSSQKDAVKKAISQSANYLSKKVKEDGMFEYRINMDPAIAVKKKYNILRHAGTIYAMSMYYQLQPDQNMRSAIERAGRYLRDESIYPISGKKHMKAVWSKPGVNGSSTSLEAKLGGTGLGLAALLSIEKIHPGFINLSDLKALGEFIIYMQKEDGSFYSKYIPSMGGRQDRWKSLYYPGEAALGLAMLYEKDFSGAWIGSAYKTLEYLARSRKMRTDIPADHWALLATAKILSLENIDALPVSRKLLIDHAIQICEVMLRDQIISPERPEYDGGFFEDGRTTPTATRLEGLIAALSFLPPNHEIHQRIFSSVIRGISFLLRAHVSEGEFAGAMPRAVGKIDGSVIDADKFNRRVTEVRIDYVQHAMSAMIQYLQFLQK